MNDKTVNALFKVLKQVLDNQQKLMKHLGIDKDDEYGFSSDTDDAIATCERVMDDYETYYGSGY